MKIKHLRIRKSRRKKLSGYRGEGKIKKEEEVIKDTVREFYADIA